MDVFSYKPKNQPKVERKKLGRNEGLYWPTFNLIEVDTRLKGKKEMIIYIHEYLHKLFPDMEEDDVIINSESIADFMWKNHFRRVDLGE
mgnify:CR=1 FL=1